ncbi:MAG: hypothetical protein WD176_03725 [Pirellulales bacterium]
MPANLVRCASCRALLNPELSPREIVAPDFIPLPEVEAVIDTPIVGYFVNCPRCRKELRINARYVGQHVACKFCDGQFPFQIDSEAVQVPAFYTDCPHCRKELRAAQKYTGAKVACKFCNGAIRFV